MPDTTTTAAATPTAPANDPVAALNKKLITNRLNEYVKAQKITKSEVAIYLDAALKDEDGTFAILDAKTTTATNAAPPVGSGVYVVSDPAPSSEAHNRYSVLQNKCPKARFAGLKADWKIGRAHV